MKVNKFLKRLYYNNDCLYDGIDYIEIMEEYNFKGDVKTLKRIISQHTVNTFLSSLKTYKNELWYNQEIESIIVSVNSFNKPVILIKTKNRGVQ